MQAFKADQENTVTPHGEISMSSVRELPDGRVSYETADGKRWAVEMTKEENGDYTYSELKQLD